MRKCTFKGVLFSSLGNQLLLGVKNGFERLGLLFLGTCIKQNLSFSQCP